MKASREIKVTLNKFKKGFPKQKWGCFFDTKLDKETILNLEGESPNELDFQGEKRYKELELK